MKLIDNHGVEWRSLHCEIGVFIDITGRLMVLGAGTYKVTIPTDLDNYNTTAHPLTGITRRSHVLVAMSWLDVPDNYDELVVDHKDGDKRNCHPDNLRWMTQKENVQAAVDTGLTSRTPIYIKKGAGEIIKYDGFDNASAVLGISASEVSHILNKKIPINYVAPDFLVSLQPNEFDGYIPDDAELMRVGRIVVVSRKNGEILGEAKSFRELASLPSIPYTRGVVRGLMSSKGSDIDDEISIQLRYNRILHKVGPTMDINENSASRTPTSCYGFDITNGEVIKYDTILMASRATGCARKRLTRLVHAKDLSVMKGGYRFSEDPDVDWSSEITPIELRAISEISIVDGTGKREPFSGWKDMATWCHRHKILSLGFITTAQNQVIEKLMDRGYSLKFHIRGTEYSYKQVEGECKVYKV